jgi:hypothetical protein
MRKIIFDCVVFMGLFTAGLVISILCYQESYITTLLRYHDTIVYTPYSSQPILGDTVVRGEVRAAYDNFAAVKLRVNTFNRMNTTHIIFRMKEKGSSTWHIVSTYALDRFVNGLFYPFGFPLIHDSKGKVYDFEVFSTDGTSDNAMGILSGYHAVATQYVFSKSVLLANKPLLTEFVTEKLKSTVGDIFSILYLGMFCIPALVWLANRMIRNRTLLPYVHVLLFGYLLLVYAYLPVDMNTNTILYIAVAGFYIAYTSRVSALAAYIVALMSLAEIPFVIAFGNTLAANKLATLIFFLMVAGGIMTLIEGKRVTK